MNKIAIISRSMGKKFIFYGADFLKVEIDTYDYYCLPNGTLHPDCLGYDGKRSYIAPTKHNALLWYKKYKQKYKMLFEKA